MITETYGGICPYCGYNRMHMRYGSPNAWQFDACPKCGFAYGTNGVEEETGDKFWESFLKANKLGLHRMGFEHSRKGVLDWSESLPPPDPDEYESIFSYPDRKFFKHKSVFIFR